VLNADSELVGVVMSSLVGGQTLNFAVPLNTVRDFLSGKPARVDAAAWINTARSLSTERDKAGFADSKWKELDTQVKDALTQAIAQTSDPDLLTDALSVASFWHRDIQAEAARKTIRITKSPTREMFARLAESVYYATDAQGPSAALDEAEQAAARAVTMGRSTIPADLVLLGNIQQQAQKLQTAYVTFAKATAVANASPNDLAIAYLQLFRVSHQLGRDPEAENWFKKSDTAVRQNAYIRSEFAGFLADRSKFSEAGDAYMEAFQQAPLVYQYVCSAGYDYYIADRNDDTLSAARKCLELATVKKGAEQEISMAHKEIANVLIIRGVYDDGAAHAREAIAVDSNDGFAYWYLARALNGQRRFTEAVGAAQTAIRLSDGKYGAMHFTLGSAYFQLKQWPEATQAFQKAAELSPKDADAAYNVGASLYNSRYYAQSLTWYREVLKRDPNYSSKEEVLRAIDELLKK
jgi:tetratricopeptide (TPR) repeat protein